MDHQEGAGNAARNKGLLCCPDIAVIQLYKNETYDWRLLAMGSTLAFTANFAIIVALQRFENFHFSLLRNLPMSLTRRAAMHLSILFILCIPEVIFLLRNFPENLKWEHSIFTILFGISICMFFFGLSYVNALQNKDPMRRVFAAAIVWFVLILFKVPLLFLASVNFITWIILFRKCFYDFEYSQEQMQNRICGIEG